MVPITPGEKKNTQARTGRVLWERKTTAEDQVGSIRVMNSSMICAKPLQ